MPYRDRGARRGPPLGPAGIEEARVKLKSPKSAFIQNETSGPASFIFGSVGTGLAVLMRAVPQPFVLPQAGPVHSAAGPRSCDGTGTPGCSLVMAVESESSAAPTREGVIQVTYLKGTERIVRSYPVDRPGSGGGGFFLVMFVFALELETADSPATPTRTDAPRNHVYGLPLIGDDDTSSFVFLTINPNNGDLLKEQEIALPGARGSVRAAR